MSEVPRLFKDAFLSYLDLPMSDRGDVEYVCVCCRSNHATFEQLTAHAESCSKLQSLRTNRHTHIQLGYQSVVGKIPGMAWRREAPRISEHFPDGAYAEGDARDRALGYLADMAIRVGDDAETLVDFTVGGVCLCSNTPR